MFSVCSLDKVILIFHFLLPFFTKKMAEGITETPVLVPAQLLLVLMLFSSRRPELKAIEKDTEVTLR